MNILRLAAKSIWNRRLTALLVVLSIAIGVSLLLGVERLRVQARTSFSQTLSGTDLIVGARGGAINLLLYSVFRMGDATNNVSWRTAEAIAAWPDVAWTVPLSLGDSHRGYRVLGTTTAYFDHYQYGQRQPLRLAAGAPFAGVFDAVLGAEVAAQLGYRVGSEITLAHGAGKVSFMQHADKPFKVVGILAPTGTPVDRTVHVSLQGIEAVHVDWLGGAPLPGHGKTPAQVQAMTLTPKTVTAVLVGLKTKLRVFNVQRAINDYRDEPLLAILPALTTQQLWDLLSVGEQALLAISGLAVVCGLLVMLTALITGMNERRREMAILRALGARPSQVFLLLVGEALLLTLCGMLAGLLLLQLALGVGLPLLGGQLGLTIAAWPPSPRELAMLGGVLLAGVLGGALPALRVYRLSLADGLTLRI